MCLEKGSDNVDQVKFVLNPFGHVKLVFGFLVLIYLVLLGKG